MNVVACCQEKCTVWPSVCRKSGLLEKCRCRQNLILDFVIDTTKVRSCKVRSQSIQLRAIVEHEFSFSSLPNRPTYTMTQFVRIFNGKMLRKWTRESLIHSFDINFKDLTWSYSRRKFLFSTQTRRNIPWCQSLLQLKLKLMLISLYQNP